MIDFNIFRGALLTSLSILIMKFIDAILEFINKDIIFGKIWNFFVRIIKRFLTKFVTLNVEILYDLNFDPVKYDYLTNNIIKWLKQIKTQYDKEILFSEPTINENKTEYHYKVDYKGLLYKMEIRLMPQYIKDKQYIDSLNIKIYYNEKYNVLKTNLNSTSALIDIINNELNREIIIRTGKGKIIICPIKANLRIDQFITNKRFDISMILKDDEKDIIINMYEKRAEIIFDINMLDHILINYIDEILINYYLNVFWVFNK